MQIHSQEQLAVMFMADRRNVLTFHELNQNKLSFGSV